MRSQLSKLIEIPDYWRDYVNPEVDLRKYPKQPCPFHDEKHGQSFSYASDRGYFSCFGACHVLGGDVVQLHMLNYKIRDYTKAEESLARLYGLRLEKKITFEKPKTHVNMREVENRIAVATAEQLATDPESWLELDMIMSQYPPDTGKLNMFINRRK